MTTPQAVHFVEVADSITPTDMPAHQYAVLAYVDGHWPTVEGCRERFPHARIITVATSPRHDAMVLDVEQGDATIPQAVAWVKSHLDDHRVRPCVYVELSKADELCRELAHAGVKRVSFRLWTAHWSGQAHICDVNHCGLIEKAAGATQYAGASEHRHYDLSRSTSAWIDALARDAAIVHSQLI
jgi:hypothetical protein